MTIVQPMTTARTGTAAPGYMPGFGNEFETEALPGALPQGHNSPQRRAYGLYAEQLSGSPFTAPRGTNERSWLYRIRPSVRHTGRFQTIDYPLWKTAPMSAITSWRSASCAGTRCRCPKEPTDFLAGMRTMTTAGDVARQTGMAAHVYVANALDGGRLFLQRRRRDADRAAAGRAAVRHRNGRHRRRAGRDLPSSRAAWCSRSSCRRPGARLCLRELRRQVHPAGARPDRRQLPGQSARLQDAGRRPSRTRRRRAG